ncbi:hypothetical protein RF11_08682 [Thelohanellus kitauei]|uniref:Uncharacterized protein n=1 Tax=Thelohanellus kitauei TaxID=669202 RepID=A0A0C2JS55_THEKT|nr:hypothetical protein RF11_08682 [Thelohanellus kitauei]
MISMAFFLLLPVVQSIYLLNPSHGLPKIPTSKSGNESPVKNQDKKWVGDEQAHVPKSQREIRKYRPMIRPIEGVGFIGAEIEMPVDTFVDKKPKPRHTSKYIAEIDEKLTYLEIDLLEVREAVQFLESTINSTMISISVLLAGIIMLWIVYNHLRRKQGDLPEYEELEVINT